MIIVKFIGGLGNQMFQYAFARRLQLQYEDELVFDTNSYETYKIRSFSLDKLNITKNKKYIQDINLKKSYLITSSLKQQIYRVYQKLKRNIDKDGKIGGDVFNNLSNKGLYFNFDSYYYKPVNLDTKKINWVYGYFQSEKYFSPIKNELMSELKVVTEPTQKEILILKKIKKAKNSVAISIRWGDDYKNTNFDVCTKEYFYKSISKIENTFSEFELFIFSDRIDLVKEEFVFNRNVNYIEGFNDYESLRLMYNCENFIISNSSFSWFGAYLSENEKKIVISPDKWKRKKGDKIDIFMDSMDLIEC